MPNTLGTTNADRIAQEALFQLRTRLPFLRQIATDLSMEEAKFGERVIVHEVATAAAATFSSATGYAPSARTQVDIPVTLNKHVHSTYSVGVQEASSARVDLVKRFAESTAFAIGSAIVQDLCALILNATFANKTTKALGAGGDAFDRKSVVGIGNALSKRDVAPFGRFMLLNPDYFASLLSDDSMMNLLVLSGQKVIGENVLPSVHGFAISEFSALPGNGENLVGFAGGRTALAFATRIPDDPGQGLSGCSISTATDAETGLSLQVREWYNADLAEFRRTNTLMYGVAAGQTDALQRIVSAVPV